MSLGDEQIHLAGKSDLASVQDFYSRVGYGCEIDPDDKLLIAREGQSVIAAVRLCREFDITVLRGMFVAEKRRGGGIGTRVLDSISAEIGSSECWCLPYAHLVNFYSRIGFRVCEDGTIPPFLAGRRNKYNAGGKNVVVMKRPAESAGNPDA